MTVKNMPKNRIRSRFKFEPRAHLQPVLQRPQLLLRALELWHLAHYAQAVPHAGKHVRDAGQVPQGEHLRSGGRRCGFQHKLKKEWFYNIVAT